MSIVNWLFEAADPLLTRMCRSAANRAQSRRHFYSNFDPYLTRVYFTKHAFKRLGVYLHYHHPGEDDLALHNHPYGWICTVMLTNGCVEERWDNRAHKFNSRLVRPGSIIIVRVDEFHRLTLVDKQRGAWALFLSGRRVQETWGFWWPHGLSKYVPHFNFSRTRLRYARPN